MPILTTGEIYETEMEIYGSDAEIPNYFRLVKAYFCDSSNEIDSIDYKKSKFILRAKGGRCFNSRDSCNPCEISHVLVDRKCFNLNEFKSSGNALQNAPIVSHEWIIDSHEAGKQLDVIDYIVEN